MSGIVYPKNWREIIDNNHVLAGSLTMNTATLKKELSLRLLEAVSLFGGEPFCLALSGGIDSSILASLLTSLAVSFTAITVGSDEKHEDLIHAQILQKHLGFEHCISILSQQRISTDAYEDLYTAIAGFGFHNVISADTVDEMLGGYWMHQKPEAYCQSVNVDRLGYTFESFWQLLPEKHLEPMELYAKKFQINVGLPYLGAHEMLRNIPISQRVDKTQRKIILRELAYEMEVPAAIITRPKLGLCSIWD